MFLRILLKKLGFARDAQSAWDMQGKINERAADYEKKKECIITDVSAAGPLITVHKLNQTPLTINSGQIQTIEEMACNSVIVFSSGNRMIVSESSQVIRDLIHAIPKKEGV